ncbi:MAG: Coenzyme F420 hydrogenase/dehydrogenase, beta subunit C-terminal domain [Planctomycetota bacterium]
MKKINDIEDVVRWRLCTGCGACVPACHEHAISLVDISDQGIRPIINSANCSECGECVKVCPGIAISHNPFNNQAISELQLAWGPILEVWEGYASDPEIRYNGSSGGIATALALYCLEKEQSSGLLHIGTKPEAPLQNVPVFSKSREELLAYTGSRYSPAAPCEKLQWIEESDSPCVFIGKPCDVVALRKSQVVNPMLNSKVSLAISIFCAGTPPTKGTYKLLDAFGVKPEEAKQLRYRGCGWPGATTVKIKGSNGQVRQMTYEESWGGILSKYGQLRCRLCPESTGEFADISCGDPWYREVEADDPGRSLVLVRTEIGRMILQEAMKADYIKLEQVNSITVPRSQKSLLRRRRHLWGRLLAMRITGIAVPHYEGFGLFANWCNLSIREKIRSVLGTFKRIIFRKLFRPVKYISGTIANGKDGVLSASPTGKRTEDS